MANNSSEKMSEEDQKHTPQPSTSGTTPMLEFIVPENSKTFEKNHVSKRSKFLPNDSVKTKCLALLINAYDEIFDRLFSSCKDCSTKATFRNNLCVSQAITDIILTVHRVRQRRPENSIEESDFEKKAKEKLFTFGFGKTYVITFEAAARIWDAEVKAVSFEYKDFAENDDQNWISTIALYFVQYLGFSATYKELKIGHSYITKKNKQTKQNLTISIDKFKLNANHHVLLEGITFSYPLKSAIWQNLGPLTVYLQMLIAKKPEERKKWENAVKIQMGTLSCIDDVISLIRDETGRLNYEDILFITMLLSEILLISTSQHMHRMYLPLGMLAVIIEDMETSAEKEAFLKKFDILGHGGYHLYNLACNKDWYLMGKMTESEASQIAFHSIFGTFKEDLGILEQISNCQKWYTRKELQTTFTQCLEKKELCKFRLPVLTHYPKWTMGNRNLGELYKMEKLGSTPTTFGEKRCRLEVSLINLLDKLRLAKTRSGKENCTWGTVDWYKMETVTTNSSETKSGVDPAFIPHFSNKSFLL